MPAYATAEDQAVRAFPIPRRTARPIAVEIADAAKLGDLQADWTDLLTRAEAPNVFMDPALLRAAAVANPHPDYRIVLAWKADDGERQLVGVWAFAIGYARRSILPYSVLIAPPCPHGYLATPVIDRSELDATLDAMLDAIAADPRLPKILTLDTMGTDRATMAALKSVLAARGGASCELAQYRRPKLNTGLDGKSYLQRALSASSRKKLRQQRRRLSEKGKLDSVVHTEPQAVRRAFEDFLALEGSGWKGRRGTAIQCNASEAEFMRSTVTALASHGRAAIHALDLDGKPIAMQIVLRAGAVAFTWKTAYDERFGDFSPGMLLFEDYTTALLADSSIEYVDSCSYDDSGFMSAWQDRKLVADLWIDARRGGSVEFRVLSALQKTYRNLRAAALETYLAIGRQRRQ